MNARPRMLVLAGDPTGIGPEITAKLLAMPEARAAASITLLGDPDVLAAGAKVAGLPHSIFDGLPFVEHRASGAPYPMGRVSREAGAFTLGTCARPVSRSARVQRMHSSSRPSISRR